MRHRLIRSALGLWRRHMPAPVMRAAAAGVSRFAAVRNRHKSNQDIFDAIYVWRRWGTDGSSACSGEGSRGAVLAKTVEPIARVIARADISSILDVGCGDFHFGRSLLDRIPGHVRYLGIDVSAVVIEEVGRAHASERVRFERRDASCDPLPGADLAVVRQVFQHLNNATIQAILANLDACAHLIVVEHFPAPGHLKSLNKDMASGPLTRRFFGSAVDIAHPPFRHRFRFGEELFRFGLGEIGGELVGRLYWNERRRPWPTFAADEAGY